MSDGSLPGFPGELLQMRTRADLIAGIGRMQGDVLRFFQDLTPAEYFARPDDGGWSPEQNLAHLIKSIRPVRLALHLPRPIYLLFGRGDASAGPQEVIRRYLGVLDGGYQAGYSYRPGRSHADGSAAPGEKRRRRALDVYARHCAGLERVLEGWSEEDLDRYRMPHPAVGKISVREMLYFTVFHPYHHIHKIRARMA